MSKPTYIAVVCMMLLAVAHGLPDRFKVYKRALRPASGFEVPPHGIIADDGTDGDLDVVTAPLTRMFSQSRFRAANDDIGQIIDEEVKKFMPEVIPDKASDDCKSCVVKRADREVLFEFNRIKDSCSAAFVKKWKEYCDKLKNDPRAVVVDIVQRDAVNPVNLAYGGCQVSGPCRGL